MSDNTGAIVGVAVAMAAERQERLADERARETIASFDPKTAGVEGRRAYAKAVYRIDGDGEPSTAEDRIQIAVLMVALFGGALWGYFGIAERMAYGDVHTMERIMGTAAGILAVVVGLLVAMLVYTGVKFVVTGRT
jgi:hypothetical protein